MSLRELVRDVCYGALDSYLYRFVPRGVSIPANIHRALPKTTFSVIFDVGANVGQSVAAVRALSREAKVYCFEPDPQTFQQLKLAVANDSKVQCFAMALGDRDESAHLIEGPSSDRSYISTSADESSSSASVAVQVTTVDTFCEANNVSRIDYLKIDTEGFDLKVLHGAKQMLQRQAINAIQVEASMNPTNTLHVPLEQFNEYLASFGYYMFGLYEQTSEIFTGQPQLRRSNPVYISSECIRLNSR